MDSIFYFFGTGIGGDSRATVLVCASPENENAVETLQALRFGELCVQKSCLNYHEIFYTSQSYIYELLMNSIFYFFLEQVKNVVLW